MEDVWVDRIKAVFSGLKDLLVAGAAIVAAWQAVNNNTVMKTNHAEWKASQQRTMSQEK